MGDSTLRLPRRRTLKAELRRPVAARRRGCVGTASREGGGEEMRRLSQLHERNVWRIAETGAAIASLVSFFMGCFLWFQFDYTRPNGPNPLSHCQKGLSSNGFRDDRRAQGRRRPDRDVGDDHRSRGHPGAEVGQRGQRAPSRLAAVAASACCRGSPLDGQLPTRCPGRGVPRSRTRPASAPSVRLRTCSRVRSEGVRWAAEWRSTP